MSAARASGLTEGPFCDWSSVKGGGDVAGARSVSHAELRERLAQRLPGRVLGAGDPGYEGSRRVFNAMTHRRPAVIVTCSSASKG